MPLTVSIVFAELASEISDVDVDHVRSGVEVVPPDVREQLLSGQHLAGMTHERLEQRELPCRQLDRSVLGGRASRVEVELDPPTWSTVVSADRSSVRIRRRIRASSSSNRNGLVT
jgi:hypothetical protein